MVAYFDQYSCIMQVLYIILYLHARAPNACMHMHVTYMYSLTHSVHVLADPGSNQRRISCLHHLFLYLEGSHLGGQQKG